MDRGDRREARPGLRARAGILTELEARLPPAQAFQQQFSPLMLNALPFHWAGYRLEVGYTYRIEDLASTDMIWDGLRDNIRREVRKARKRVEVVENLGVDRFYDVLSQTTRGRTSRRRTRSPSSSGSRRRARATTPAPCCSPATTPTGSTPSAWIVWDRSAAYYLLAGAEPTLRTSGAGSLLVWEAIVRAAAVTDVFDFHGSMLQPVERFVRAFGSRQTPYLRVTRTSPAARLALAARAASQRVAPLLDEVLAEDLPERALGDLLAELDDLGHLEVGQALLAERDQLALVAAVGGTTTALTISSPSHLGPGRRRPPPRALAGGPRGRPRPRSGSTLWPATSMRSFLRPVMEDTTLGVDAAEVAREEAAVAEGLAVELLRCRRSLA